MLAKKNRADKKNIEKIWKEGRFLGSFNISLKFILIPGTTHPRVSFIVPKTVSKKATERNFLRRRGYAVIQKKLNLLPKELVGAFVFGKNSIRVFGGRKNKENNPILNLNKEIGTIINRL